MTVFQTLLSIQQTNKIRLPCLKHYISQRHSKEKLGLPGGLAAEEVERNLASDHGDRNPAADTTPVVDEFADLGSQDTTHNTAAQIAGDIVVDNEADMDIVEGAYGVDLVVCCSEDVVLEDQVYWCLHCFSDYKGWTGLNMTDLSAEQVHLDLSNSRHYDKECVLLVEQRQGFVEEMQLVASKSLSKLSTSSTTSTLECDFSLKPCFSAAILSKALL